MTKTLLRGALSTKKKVKMIAHFSEQVSNFEAILSIFSFLSTKKIDPPSWAEVSPNICLPQILFFLSLQTTCKINDNSFSEISNEGGKKEREKKPLK